jgi:hypothetical protein
MPDFPMFHGMRARAVHVVREGVIERPDAEAGIRCIMRRMTSGISRFDCPSGLLRAEKRVRKVQPVCAAGVSDAPQITTSAPMPAGERRWSR